MGPIFDVVTKPRSPLACFAAAHSLHCWLLTSNHLSFPVYLYHSDSVCSPTARAVPSGSSLWSVFNLNNVFNLHADNGVERWAHDQLSFMLMERGVSVCAPRRTLSNQTLAFFMQDLFQQRTDQQIFPAVSKGTLSLHSPVQVFYRVPTSTHPGCYVLGTLSQNSHKQKFYQRSLLSGTHP
jgi:hypothetical protein